LHLLSGLVYVQCPDEDRLVRLTCSTSNPERSGGGTPYYRIARSDVSLLCSTIDAQVTAHMAQIQVDPELVPLIRAAYTHDITERLGHLRPSDRARLEAELKAIDGEESRIARLLASGKITESVWNNLWEEWQDRRRTLRHSLDGVAQQVDTHIAHLDQALTVISKVGVLFETMERSAQKALLREMVERVVVDPEGHVIRLELLPPFSYLHRLTGQYKGSKRGTGKTKTSKVSPTGLSSNDLSSGGPEG